MKAPLIVWDRKKYCHFHQDHGHDTEDFIQLKDEIETLIRCKYLKKFIHDQEVWMPTEQPARQQAKEEISNRPIVGMINIIFGGVEPGDYSESSLKRKQGEDVISFSNDDL